MSHGISGGKQVIKFSNTSNRGRVYLFCQNKTQFHSRAKCTYRVLARFTSLLFAMRTSTIATAYKKVTMITSNHILTLSSLKRHSQLCDCADLDTTFASLKSIYLNPKSNLCIAYIQKTASILPSVSFNPQSFTENLFLSKLLLILLHYFIIFG